MALAIGKIVSSIVTIAVSVAIFPPISVTVIVTSTGVSVFEQLKEFGVTVIDSIQLSVDPLLISSPVIVTVPFSSN